MILFSVQRNYHLADTCYYRQSNHTSMSYCRPSEDELQNWTETISHYSRLSVLRTLTCGPKGVYSNSSRLWAITLASESIGPKLWETKMRPKLMLHVRLWAKQILFIVNQYFPLKVIYIKFEEFYTYTCSCTKHFSSYCNSYSCIYSRIY